MNEYPSISVPEGIESPYSEEEGQRLFDGVYGVLNGAEIVIVKDEIILLQTIERFKQLDKPDLLCIAGVCDKYLVSLSLLSTGIPDGCGIDRVYLVRQFMQLNNSIVAEFNNLVKDQLS